MAVGPNVIGDAECGVRNGAFVDFFAVTVSNDISTKLGQLEHAADVARRNFPGEPNLAVGHLRAIHERIGTALVKYGV